MAISITRPRHRVQDESAARVAVSHSTLVLASLLLIAVLFCLPGLINASGAHSDAASVGLQAVHILRGEWSWFIWGTDYQGTIDPALIALGFAIGGVTPLILMIVPLIGHLILVSFAFATLRRHLSLPLTAVATLPLVFVPRAIYGVSLYAPRQWAITFIFAAIWLLDSALAARRPLPRLLLAGFLSTVAFYSDMAVMTFLPGVFIFALACCLSDQPARKTAIRRIAVGLLGASGGIVIFIISRLAVTDGPNSIRSAILLGSLLRRNVTLLWEQTLPWLLSYGVYIPDSNLALHLWQTPAYFVPVQIVGAVLLVAGIVFGGAAIAIRAIPEPVRRLGLLGFVVTMTTIGGFLVSSQPADMWSVRYLAMIVWIAPFALAPAAWLLTAKRFPALIAPYLVAAAVGGWLGFGPYVHGVLPTRAARGVAAEELVLGQALREHGVQYAAAQYWLSYRLTFLWNESTIVVPLELPGDRYPPYRKAYEQAPVVAYIFQEADPNFPLKPCEDALSVAGIRYERLVEGPFTALIAQRGAGMDDPPGCTYKPQRPNQ